MEESVKIVVLDFYMASPIPGLDVTYSEFRGSSVNQVPILRCFGSARNGKKICMHIHGVFPYLYIPFDGVGNAEGLMYQIAANIDKAVNTSLNQGSSSTQHVYKISLVSGIPMYGYHPKKHQFFKIYLYNPMLVSTVTNLLVNHSILDRIFQPHEAHINFTLQFMIDYNLHGMSNMVISDLKFRVDPDNPNTKIEKELFLPTSVEKISTCELEGDINADNIFNRQEILNGNFAVNPGIAALWADEKQRRRNKGEDSQLGQFLELKNMKFTPTKTHLIFQQALAERLAVCSTDKNIPKGDLNLSVYPAETPINASIQNASLIDIHTPSSLELSLDDTINTLNNENLDETITPTQGNLNATMDEDAHNFLKLLEQLAGEKAMENTNEEDSILSQTVRDDEPNNDSNEDFLDLSMPLGAVTTPRKVDAKDNVDKSDDENDNYFETTLIPQVDGHAEMSDSGDDNMIVNRTRSKSRGIERSIDTPKDAKTRCGKSKRSRKTSEEKLEEQLRLIRFRINRINAKSTVKRVGKVVRKKEMRIGNLLRKFLKPKFNVVSGRKWFLESRNNVNSPIVSQIIKHTHNYIDPTLHLLVKQPNNKNFLYYYGGRAIPEITEVSPNQLESERMKLISDTRPNDTKKDSIKRQKMKILQNKILNIKEPKRLETKNECDDSVKTFIKQEPLCEVTSAAFPDTIKVVILKTESETKYCSVKEEKNTKMFKTNLREEDKQADLALQRHVQQLRDFDIYEAFAKTKREPNVTFDILNELKCLNNDSNIESPKNVVASTFLHKTEETCAKTNVLGEIQNLEKTSGSGVVRNKLNLEILNSSNDDFDAKENVTSVDDIMTLMRSPQLQKHEKCTAGHNKELNLTQLQILADIDKKSEYILNFESVQYNKEDLEIPKRQILRHSLDEFDANCDISMEGGHNRLTVMTNETFERRRKSPTSDSGYMSLSSSSSGKNISCEFQSEQSVSVFPDVGLNNLLKSNVSAQINLTLEGPLHVQCVQCSASTPLVGSNASSFEYGADDHEKISDSGLPCKLKSKPEWDHTYSHPYMLQLIKKRRRSTPNIYINCDGAVDSSSEDEETKTKGKKRARRRRALSQYAPLQISVNKSPRTPGRDVEGVRAGLADIMTAVSGDQKDFLENSSQVAEEMPLSKSVSFKRKLSFENGVSLNSTTHQEFLSCAYSPKTISRTNISALVNDTTVKILDKSPVETAEKGFDQTSNNSQSANETTTQQLGGACSDSDLFSEEEDMNKSFFKSYQLSTSEKYDRETKYRAKEGCSTIFTPSSVISQDPVFSQRNSISQVSSGHNSKDITPNQEAVVVENSQDVPSEPSSDITPYQNFEQLNNDKSPKNHCSFGNFKIFKPVFCAPTRLEVERSLNELKIAEVTVTEPFYSDVEDYTGVVEVGQNTIRIHSKTACHLPDFESDFEGIIKYRKRFTENVANLIWNSNNLKSLKVSHCNNRDIIIHPIKKCPSVRDVQQWLQDNSKEKVLPSTPEDKNTRSKIYIPNSPGNDQDELELSLSITPCTPVSSQAKSTQSNELGTPTSSLASQNSSPILDHRNKKRKKKNSIKKLNLRDSLLSTEEKNKSCQITGISQNNTFGFSKSVQNLQAVRVVLEHQYLTTMVMELHIRTRGDLKPDPEYDPICAIFYSVLNDVPETYSKKTNTRGVVALNYLPIDKGKPNEHFLDGICIDCDIVYAETEESLIKKFLLLINYWDPDILAGYEIQMLSWGYFIDRASVLSMNIIPLLGRSQINKYGRSKQKNTNYEIESVITGRIILNVWRIMRHEIALQSYTFESIVYHILHKRVPMFAFKNLSFWWDHKTNLYRHRVVSYYLLRVGTVLELFDKLDFLNRTSELASLFGILFYEVLSRGSQFRVESMMLRLAKPLNYVPVSPSQAQRVRMKAPEYIALVMEPESKLYNDPVIVLDFQSLYPSIIIAYNYCFTTCIGRVSSLGSNVPYEFGATQLKVPRKLVEKLSTRDLLNFSPAGVAFVKQKVRRGILPRMLTEILETRLMVKNSMKENKGNENLQKVLHNRQLGLKLIANVTYGYTAANYSGRMCCVEVGDSVVSKARETLQRAIALVESTTEWGARVVYGDTDSLFVLVAGKTRDTAFEIGKKIADAITADNPDPIKLKLEKVYQPCILQTKKRYVGYMYESPDQKEPVYDAKGIETVRRDGCPAVSKMLQKCLTLLFETKDVSLVKKYILRQFHKIQAGRASIQDLTFAKEYRGASGYKPGACVPALELARKWQAIDRRSEPRSGERVPYIIVNGPPGLPLIRLVRSPRDLLNDNSLRPNSLYYITKVIIPAINRCFNLLGADLHTWFNQMPRKNTLYLPNSSPIVKSTISQYFVSKICASCSQPTQNGLCDRCCQNASVTAFTLVEKLRKWEENFYNTRLICHSCTGHLDDITCISLDCPVIYRRTQTYNDLQQSTYVRELLASSDIFSEDRVFDD